MLFLYQHKRKNLLSQPGGVTRWPTIFYLILTGDHLAINRNIAIPLPCSATRKIFKKPQFPLTVTGNKFILSITCSNQREDSHRNTVERTNTQNAEEADGAKPRRVALPTPEQIRKTLSEI
jgi:hypothetical protein